ncbi:PREDICTED: nuclear GTPase SLIP-GC-like, partial [Poecilia mexicana]
MDDFVRDTLAQAGLSDWIKVFKDEGIDTETFYMLQDANIEKLIPKMGPNLKFKKLLRRLKAEQTQNESPNHFPTHGHQKGEEATDMTEVLPSTSGTEQGKRKSGQQLDSKGQPAAKRKCETNSSTEREAKILSEVRNIMEDITAKLQDDSDLNKFLKEKIENLETEKRELVGVFGKTGAGKTSLINAVLEEENLLPCGRVKACTSVMIKVEANRHNKKYEAEIEFISPEDWEDELGSLLCIIEKRDKKIQDNDDYDTREEYRDALDKLSALYGEEWRGKSCKQLMDRKCFNILEILYSTPKTLVFDSADDLSADMVKYTRVPTKEKACEEIKQWYWPLVKCVTIRVPDNPFLQHVTLVDLPGNGDRNKSRDTMWKGIVADCSTVWVVGEINRIGTEKELWDILDEIESLIGNGGECQRIHIIGTKSDDSGKKLNGDEARTSILETNSNVKEYVREEINQLTKIKKHFSDECFQVFTVSATEFFMTEVLTLEETEIPKLQEVLQNLNDCHSETLNYVSGAHGILSLVHGASKRKE